MRYTTMTTPNKLLRRWKDGKGEANPNVVAWFREQALAGKNKRCWRTAKEGDVSKCFHAVGWSVAKGAVAPKSDVPSHCMVDIPKGSLVSSCWGVGEELECFECACVSDEDMYTERMMEAVHWDSGGLKKLADAVLCNYVPLSYLTKEVDEMDFLKEDVQGQIIQLVNTEMLVREAQDWESAEDWESEMGQLITEVRKQVRRATLACSKWRTDLEPPDEFTREQAAIYLKLHEEYYPDGPAVPYLRFLVQRPEPLRTAG
jgi:hypothetical protein